MARSKKNGKTPKDATSKRTQGATADVVTINRRLLLEAIVPDATWAGSPWATALVYAADELDALVELSSDGVDIDDLLFRLRSRMRAISEILPMLEEKERVS